MGVADLGDRTGVRGGGGGATRQRRRHDLPVWVERAGDLDAHLNVGTSSWYSMMLWPCVHRPTGASLRRKAPTWSSSTTQRRGNSVQVVVAGTTAVGDGSTVRSVTATPTAADLNDDAGNEVIGSVPTESGRIQPLLSVVTTRVGGSQLPNSP
jgi:hypothetical protein